MAEDNLIIIAAVISAVIFIELIVALFLCIKCSKRRDPLCCSDCSKCESGCFSHKKLHKYKIRKLSIQSSESRSVSIDNRINWKLPFPYKPTNVNNNNAGTNINNQLFTIDATIPRIQPNAEINNELQNQTPRTKNKNRMNSYLYAINYKNIINQIETENVFRKADITFNNEYKFNIDPNLGEPFKEENRLSNDMENNSTNLNTESPITDNSIPSPPSSLNLVSLSRCPSPPAPLSINPYRIKSDFESVESDETNQLRHLFNEKLKTNNFFGKAQLGENMLQKDNLNQSQNNEASLLSSINFIRFYLDKFDTQINQKPIESFNSKDETDQNIKILNEYLSQSNAEEIIENTIELIKNFKPVSMRPSNNDY